jgi:hypothetical protein
LAPALAGLLVGPGWAADAEKKPPKELASFGTLRATPDADARAQAQEWLKATGKADDKAFSAIWDDPGKSTLDKVADTLSLGDAEAAKLLAEARDPASPAPQAVPALLRDAKKSAFYRANLALAYAKALSNRKVYEESLETLRTVAAEQVVDPSAYLFHRAVAEHALTLRNEANYTIIRLLDDVTDTPERYKMVAALMVYDMLGWQDKDLGSIARKMDNIERRLELARGGPKTQKLQKEVVSRLDEMIKELENQAGGS